jgi:hypothetical protein
MRSVVSDEDQPSRAPQALPSLVFPEALFLHPPPPLCFPATPLHIHLFSSIPRLDLISSFLSISILSHLESIPPSNLDLVPDHVVVTPPYCFLFFPSPLPERTSKKRTVHSPSRLSPSRAVICGVRFPSKSRCSSRRLSAARVSLQACDVRVRRLSRILQSATRRAGSLQGTTALFDYTVRGFWSWWWPTLRPSFTRG